MKRIEQAGRLLTVAPVFAVHPRGLRETDAGLDANSLKRRVRLWTRGWLERMDLVDLIDRIEMGNNC